MQNLPLLTLVATLVACRAPCPPIADATPVSLAAPCPNASDAAAPVPSAVPVPAVDASAEPHDSCWNAAQHLILLGCKDSRGRLLGGSNLSGATWSAVCRQDLANGVSLNSACVIGATTCAAAEVCK